MGIILEKETFEKFGYNVYDLKQNSYKHVYWKCCDCGVVVEKKYRYAKNNNRCLNCSNKKIAFESKEKLSIAIKKWFETHEHPLKGTKRPENVKIALKIARENRVWTQEQRDHHSRLFSCSGNPFYGKKHSKESIEKFLESNKNNTKRGKESNLYGKCYHGKGSWHVKVYGEKVWMRSSWELKYAKYLDSKNIKWEYEPKIFDLIIDGKECSYRPDFYLSESDEWIELKGYWRDDAKVKFDAFLLQYPTLNVKLLMKNELKKLGVL